MGKKVLTADSSIVCSHDGTIPAVPGQSKLKVDGAFALVQGDVAPQSVSGCSYKVSSSGETVCTKVARVLTGPASKLTVGGKPVLLDDLAGATVGSNDGPTFSVDDPASQSLEAT